MRDESFRNKFVLCTERDWKGFFRRIPWHLKNNLWSLRKFHILEYQRGYGQNSPALHVSGEMLTISNLEGIESLRQRGVKVGHLDTAVARRRLCEGSIVWCVICDGEVAHTSWVVTGPGQSVDALCNLVNSGASWYIGDCYTQSRYGGRGFYRAVLRHVCDLAESAVDRVVISVEEGNEVSLKSALKSGFRSYSTVMVRTLFGRKSVVGNTPAGQPVLPQDVGSCR